MYCLVGNSVACYLLCVDVNLNDILSRSGELVQGNIFQIICLAHHRYVTPSKEDLRLLHF